MQLLHNFVLLPYIKVGYFALKRMLGNLSEMNKHKHLNTSK